MEGCSLAPSLIDSWQSWQSSVAGGCVSSNLLTALATRSWMMQIVKESHVIVRGAAVCPAHAKQDTIHAPYRFEEQFALLNLVQEWLSLLRLRHPLPEHRATVYLPPLRAELSFQLSQLGLGVSVGWCHTCCLVGCGCATRLSGPG